MARYDQNNNPYSWMPGFLRRFMNLDYDEPQATAQGSSQPNYSLAARPAAQPSWSPPSEPSFKPTSMEGYTPPAGSYSAPPPAGGYSAPPPPQPRPANGDVGGPPVGSAVPTEGYIQPVTYLLRGYARGVLPPQGLEQFAKETRATTTDVWNLYSHWVRFQTEEVFRFGRELLDVVLDAAPGGSPPPPAARRIKVTVANGNGNHSAAVSPAAAEASAAAAASAAIQAEAAAKAAEDAAAAAKDAADDAAKS